MRILRESQHVATREHFCDNCFEYIQPGSLYRRTACLIGGKFFVLKEHREPVCERPDDPPDDDDKDLDAGEELLEAA